MEALGRNKYCGELNINSLRSDVILCGWVQKNREFGKLVFVDLRDRTGIIQLVFDDKLDNIMLQTAAKLHLEDVIQVKGVVRERESKNKNIPTGDIEVYVNELVVLSKAETPPFEVTKVSDVSEETRLKYRYLELRNSEVQKKIIMRHKITKITRNYFYEKGFLEIETPILIKSTPEGARDYLVPSRVFKGKFFALPQSPQLYKQLTMFAGFDKYIQIARCFRDEDLRADRQPEFTQIDIEASFVKSEDIMSLAEGFMKKLYKESLNIDIDIPFKRISYEESMNKYGSDKPDLRFGMKIVTLDDIVKNTQFKLFSNVLNQGGTVRGINAKGIASFITRKDIDSIIEDMKGCGAKGVAFTKINEDDTSSSSYEKFLSENEKIKSREHMDAKSNDVIFIIADIDKQLALELLGMLRCKIASKYRMIKNENEPNLLWVVDFPMFEYDKEEKRYIAKHHPFTSPCDKDLEKLERNPGGVHANAYDLVLNGNEIGGGSIRINNKDIQNRVFNVLGLNENEAKNRFGFLLDALKYGAPPHGGMAFGLDRLIMIMLNCKSIKEVIAFPKVASSAEVMTGAPGNIDENQINELGIDFK